MDVGLILQLVVIAFLWGGTNPLIKKGSKGIEKVESHGGYIARFLRELSFLFLNWKYLVPFGLNQLGSLLFFFVLQDYDLNITVPVTNSLSYVFTCVVGYLLGESKPNIRTIVGVLFIVAGTACFMLSKADDCSSNCSKCSQVT